MERKKAVTLRAREIKSKRRRYRQRLNPGSYFEGTFLANYGGFERTGVSIAWLPPGKESFAYHAHHYEEEWIYILEGRAVSEADGKETTLGPGDFVAFPTPSVPHLLKNPFDAECVYLMGGERRPLDILDYPRLGKTYLLRAKDGPTDFFELGEPIQPFGRAEDDAGAEPSRRRRRKTPSPRGRG
jgi:uncharacterized cupin superfamily protein